MTLWLQRWFAVLVLVLPLVSIAGTPEETELARLVKELGADDFTRREAASQRLASASRDHTVHIWRAPR
jgi:hypothetical protein